MNPFLDLLDLAINSHLKQHEHQVLLVLLRQTLGFGKSADNLTNKRIAHDSNIRLDHCLKAILSLVDKGVFCREVSDYYDFRYSIPAEIAPPEEKVYCPTIPDLPASNSKNWEEPSKFRKEIPNSGDIHCNTFTDCLPLQQQPETSNNNDESFIDINSDIVEKMTLLLPAEIDRRLYKTCLTALGDLPYSQCQRVIDAFKIRVATGKVIFSTIGLFIHFCKLEKIGGLTLSQPYEPTPKQSSHPSHQTYVKPDPEEEAKERRVNDLRWLKNTSKQMGITIEQLAEKRGMMSLLTPLER